MTLALIAVIVFLIIWGNQVGNMKAAQAEEKRLTRTNVALEREVAKKEFYRLISKMAFVDRGYDIIVYLANLHESEDIPMEWVWLRYTEGDSIEEKLKKEKSLAKENDNFNPVELYHMISKRYWALQGKSTSYAMLLSFTEYDITKAATSYITLLCKSTDRIYDNNCVDMIYKGIEEYKKILNNESILSVISDEDILSLPPLPYVNNQHHQKQETISKLVSIRRFPMYIRLLASSRALYIFNQFVHYGILKREMHNLGYAVSEDGIHESDIQEREKADKAHEEEKKKYPWMYHDNKYVNSDKSFWDRMK